MKTIITIIFIFIFTTTQFAQNQLTKPKEFLKDLSIQVLSWRLTFEYEDEENKPHTAKKELVEFYDYIYDTNPDTLKPNLVAEYELLEKHQLVVLKIFSEGLLLIGNETAMFLRDKNDPPCRFIQFKQEPVLVISSVVSAQICNTLRLDEKARREKFIDEYLVNALEDCYRATGNTFKNIGVAITYGTKDFSSDGFLNQKPEIVFVISSLKLQNQLSNFEITLEEYKAKLTVFHYSRDRDSFVKIQ